ncbi:uncharacterized protein LOC144178934 isoform X1 [Haemaphysalis longicornis]
MAEEESTPLVTTTTNGQETRTGPTRLHRTLDYLQYRYYEDFSSTEKCFYASSLLFRLISVGSTIKDLATLPTHLDDYTFTIIVLVTELFSIYHIIHGVHRKSWAHILVNCATGTVLVIYSSMQMSWTTRYFIEEECGIKVRLVVSVVVVLFSAWRLWPMVKEYCRKSRSIHAAGSSGANAAEKTSILDTICRSLIIFELQLQITILFFVLETGLDMTKKEGAILAIGLFGTVLWTIAGFRTIRTKNACWLFVFLLLWLYSFAYIVYKLHRLPYLFPTERWTPLYKATLACLIINIFSKLGLTISLSLVVCCFSKVVDDTQQQRNDPVGESPSPSSPAEASSSKQSRDADDQPLRVIQQEETAVRYSEQCV